MTSANVQITEQLTHQFQREGYFVLDQVVPAGDLELLRQVCADMIIETDKRIDRGDTHLVSAITHKHKRYFIDGAYQLRPELGRFIFSDYMAQICRATLGPNVYLFKNQFVVKCAEVGMKFAWHQDSGYIAEPHLPYLTCWCALDDVSEENGTVWILPWSRSDSGGQFIDHVHELATNDLVGYFGDDSGEPVIVRAGGMAVLSSLTLHRSGANKTNRARRVYLVTYASRPMPMKEGTTRQAIPFLKDGQRVKQV